MVQLRSSKGKTPATEPETPTQDTGTIRQETEAGPSGTQESDEQARQVVETIEDDSNEAPEEEDVESMIAREQAKADEVAAEVVRRKAIMQRKAKKVAIQKRIEELQKLKDDRIRLEQELRKMVQDGDGEEEEEGEPEPLSKRRRANPQSGHPLSIIAGSRSPSAGTPRPHSEEPIPFVKPPAPKMKELPTFHAKNIHECQTFLSTAERRFRRDNGYYFRTDQQMIDYCVDAFDTKPERLWSGIERDLGVSNITWEEFKEKVFGMVSDKENRILGAVVRYENAKQREHQTVDEFVLYLEGLERELEYTDDGPRKLALYSKFKDSIKCEINRRETMPRTRLEMISVARKIEATEKMNSKLPDSKKSRKEEGNKSDDPPKGNRSGTSGSNTAGQKDARTGFSDANQTPIGGGSGRDLSDITCSICKKTGHYASRCADVVCFKCNQKGHIASKCRNMKQEGSGNGQARS